MINTILFDLDGTVLPMDLQKFLQIYFTELGKHFMNITDPKQFVKHVGMATEYVIHGSDNNRTNEETFMDRFGELIDGDLEMYRKLFDSFYDQGFENVKASTYISQEMIESIRLLQEKGYTIALATNPIFPLKANHHRIRWAGLHHSDFTYISSFETNHYCKPSEGYYIEVLNALNKKREECLMVGNDIKDDMVCNQYGIKTYLIKNHLINSKNLNVEPDYSGNYKDFLEFVKSLPSLK